jgi:hypothetical protein
VLFLGNDWAEAHHDNRARRRGRPPAGSSAIAEGVEGLAALHALIAEHLDEAAEPDQVVVGVESDRGPWVQALIAAGYTVYAINPRRVARYRERHGTAGAKSDPGDAHVLAELVRLDRAHHRLVAGNSALAEHVNEAAKVRDCSFAVRRCDRSSEILSMVVSDRARPSSSNGKSAGHRHDHRSTHDDQPPRNRPRRTGRLVRRPPLTCADR